MPEPVSLPGGLARVFLGGLAGHHSPVQTFTPLLGAQIDLESRAEVVLDVDPAFEHGVLCDDGAVKLCDVPLDVDDLGYQGPGRSALPLRNLGDAPARVLLLGGTPFTEELVLWWNFIGRSHDEIVGYRRQWQDGDERFGTVSGYRGNLARLPAPPMPTVRLRPRTRRNGA